MDWFVLLAWFLPAVAELDFETAVSGGFPPSLTTLQVGTLNWTAITRFQRPPLCQPLFCRLLVLEKPVSSLFELVDIRCLPNATFSKSTNVPYVLEFPPDFPQNVTLTSLEFHDCPAVVLRLDESSRYLFLNDCGFTDCHNPGPYGTLWSQRWSISSTNCRWTRCSSDDYGSALTLFAGSPPAYAPPSVLSNASFVNCTISSNLFLFL